jgi:hypothetical protein
VLRKQLNIEVSTALLSNPNIKNSFPNGTVYDQELYQYFSTHINQIDFGVAQNIKTAFANVGDNIENNREIAVNNMKKWTKN